MATAMAEQNQAMTDTADSGSGTDLDGKKRRGPYFNANNKIVEEVDRRIKAWQDDQDADATTRDAVVEALLDLRTFAVTERDAERDTVDNPGKHYVGVTLKGERVHFKSVQVPTEKTATEYKRVYGPFQVKAGADFVVKFGTSKAGNPIFNRSAK